MSQEHNDEHKDDCCSGHDHSKAAPESIALNPDAKGDLQTTLRITGMDCADEVAALEQVLRPLKGVREVRVQLTPETALIADGDTFREASPPSVRSACPKKPKCVRSMPG